jgi:4-diphosphocytidyl-2C-methyl-D-erythritol kinase
MEVLKVLAYAKLNLVLRVVGRREDGYHLLQSLFCAVDLADEIILEAIPRGVELLAPPDLGPPQQNLAYRAAQALLGSAGPGVRIHLRKRIPVGAGLGGGSSDAAAVLAGLNFLFELGKTVDELRELGAKLGADVPFFLGKSPAWVEGIGDRSPPRKCQFQRPSFWWSHPSAAQPLWSTKSSMNLGFLFRSLGRFPVFHRFRMTFGQRLLAFTPSFCSYGGR